MDEVIRGSFEFRKPDQNSQNGQRVLSVAQEQKRMPNLPDVSRRMQLMSKSSFLMHS